MKPIERAIYAFVAINVLLAAAYLLIAPDQVPVHFGLSGEENRTGSKYEQLFLPGIALAFGLGMIYTAHRCNTHETSMLLKADVVLQVLLLAFSLFVYSKTFSLEGTPFEAFHFNLTRGGAIITGIALVACGNIMPKSQRNDSFGVRTPWSLSNDEVWRKSNRFGGYVSIITGLLILICGLVLPIQSIIVTMLALALIGVSIGVVASYVFYRKHYK